MTTTCQQRPSTSKGKRSRRQNERGRQMSENEAFWCFLGKLSEMLGNERRVSPGLLSLLESLLDRLNAEA
jgi:hypothetical protein